MQNQMNREAIRKLTLGAVLTALVILVQIIGTYTTFFGPFSTAVALPVIVIGAVLCGWSIGTWLGLVFGVIVLFTNSHLFFMFSIPGTIVTVLLKGAACGLAAGLVYKLLKKLNKYVATIIAAAVCPIVNTGVFLLGSAVFFLDSAEQIAENLGLEAISGMNVFYTLATANFLFEIGLTIVLCPVIIRIINLRNNSKASQ